MEWLAVKAHNVEAAKRIEQECGIRPLDSVREALDKITKRLIVLNQDKTKT